MSPTIKRQFFRFVLVGVTCTLLNLLLLWCLVTYARLHYLAAASVCFVAINLAGFYLNRVFSFEATHAKPTTQLAKYYAVMTASFVLNLGLMYFFVDVFSLHFLTSSIAVTLVFVIANFFSHKFFTFS